MTVTVFLSVMSYALVSVYLDRWFDPLGSLHRETANLSFNLDRTRINPASKMARENHKPIPGGNGEITTDVPPYNGSEPVGGGSDTTGIEPLVTRIRLPMIEVEMPEGVSWLTISKMLSLVLLTYLGLKLINLAFKRTENLFNRRVKRA